MKKLVNKMLMKLYSPLFFRIEEERNIIHKDLQRQEIIINKRTSSLADQIRDLQKTISKVYDIAHAEYDETNRLTRELFLLRETEQYKESFRNEPLISVRIATYNRADKLIDIAIASVLKQTYKNFEIVVIGDDCTDDTGSRIAALKNNKIRFYNLPNKIILPDDKIKKWRVVGAHAKNTAAAMARGQWIATLDDDDEITPDHLEKLITHAMKTRCELVYGAATQKNLTTGKEKRLWSFPPQRGEFTFNSAIYMKALDSIYKSDVKAWVLEEVHDWTLCRRMMESGVKIAAIKDNLSYIYMVPPHSGQKDYLKNEKP